MFRQPLEMPWLVSTLALYVPLCAVLLAWLGRPLRRRMGASVLLSALWVTVGLLAVQSLNARMGWWMFDHNGLRFVGIPVELYLAWVALWGAMPALLFRRVAIAWAVLFFAALDVVAMPLCSSMVKLSANWWMGELVALGGVLLPAVLLARWTLEDRHTGLRGAMQVILAGALFLWMLPTVALALTAERWSRLPRGFGLVVVAETMGMLALPGLSAVQEFCERGGGTPIPMDAPKRLVVSGVYRYMANPMQISCAVVMLVWGAALGSWWVAAIGLMSFAYSAGIARWDEREDLRGRFGERWVRYRAEVRDWRWRWRPIIEPGREATIYIAETCDICSEVAAWFAARGPVGMKIVAAEDYLGSPLRRMRYVAAEGEPGEDGLRAFARGLEHLNVLWMLVGAAMRLPVLREVLQAIADANGMGPRDLCATRRGVGSESGSAGK